MAPTLSVQEIADRALKSEAPERRLLSMLPLLEHPWSPTQFNFHRTGLTGPKITLFLPTYVPANTPFSNHVTATVPRDSLRWPTAADDRGNIFALIVKGLIFGQRLMK